MNPMEQMMAAPAQAPKPAPEPSPSKVEITPPDGLDLSEFEEGKEGDMVSKWKMYNGKLCLVSIAGIPVSQSTEAPEEEVDVEEEAPQEETGKNSGDRFMKKFRPQPKPVGSYSEKK